MLWKSSPMTEPSKARKSPFTFGASIVPVTVMVFSTQPVTG